ncbi:MAG: TRAP transporter small permease subunit [Thiovulaceae bacterium]|jgi:TRAP-type mannitol/chloroaromatic compound transport system permease small subunit|nr:TRAP transporter small permease subunit [Sulfurimonadaceae bacterium]MDD3817642.1 TRAP transporter small permease subunit [Sulfurimonadaceae bacterium]
MIAKTTTYLGYLTALVLAALVILVVYDATMRYIFSGGSLALQELEWHLFDVVILFAIAYTLKEGAHVRVDILYHRFTPKTKAVVDIFAALFFILPFSFLIVYLGIDFVHMSFVQNEASSDPGGLGYRYLVKSLLPLSFVFLALQALCEVKKNYVLWRSL